MKPAFSFQVTSKGVIINFNPEFKYSSLKEALLKHVNESSEFFAGVDIYINLSECTFEFNQLQKIMDIVSQYEKVNKIYFTDKEKIGDNDLSYTRDSILVKRTIRSGQRVKYPTNIVIVGDVNPGAEVIAAGDIIVLGKLRGVVHAGARGSMEAQVVAFKLQPTQLRIASIISRPPEDDEHGGGIKPEKAFVRERSIIVEEINF